MGTDMFACHDVDGYHVKSTAWIDERERAQVRSHAMMPTATTVYRE